MPWPRLFSRTFLVISTTCLSVILGSCSGSQASSPPLPVIRSAQLEARNRPHYTITVLGTLGGTNNSASAINVWFVESKANKIGRYDFL